MCAWYFIFARCCVPLSGECAHKLLKTNAPAGSHRIWKHLFNVYISSMHRIEVFGRRVFVCCGCAFFDYISHTGWMISGLYLLWRLTPDCDSFFKLLLFCKMSISVVLYLLRKNYFWSDLWYITRRFLLLHGIVNRKIVKFNQIYNALQTINVCTDGPESWILCETMFF